MDEPSENTNQRHDKEEREQQDRETNIQKTENEPLAERTSEIQDETSEGQASGVRRPDNQDETSEERALAIRRPDNQDKTSEGQASGVRRPDNQDETSEEQALGVRRPDNQDETSDERALAIRRTDYQDETSEGRALGVRRPDNQEQTEYSPSEKLLRDERAQRAADLCEATLKSVYKTTGSFIQMIPWVDDDKRPYIINIHPTLVTDIEIARCRMTFKRIPINGKLTSYESIFILKTEEGETVKLCVFNGLPGRGKSSLFEEMAYDWAIGSVPAMQGFKLVLLLKMHALEQSSDLVDAMFDQLLVEDVGFEKGDLQSYIEKNPEKVLILLDGFDELITTNLCESSFGSILNILNRKMLRGCRALVSTRPSHYGKLVSKQLVQNPFKHIRVMGFGAEEVYVYVHRFYFEEHDKAKALLARIGFSKTASELAESPMLLLLMCLLWREDSKLPDTFPRLYSEGVKYICRRKGGVSEEDTAKCVHEIGKVGLKGLLSPNQTLSFKEKDFDKDDMMRLAIKVGILTSKKVLKKLDTHNSVQFIHKTFQEYCAGKYLKHLRKVDPVEFQKNLDQIMSLHPDKFEFLLRFCCGDSEECTRAVLQLLRARFPDKCSLGESLGNLAAKCYIESQSTGLVDEEFLHFLIPSHLQIESSDALTQCFLKCVAEHAKDRGSDCLAKIEEVRIETTDNVDRSRSDLTKPLTNLKGCMTAMTNLKGLVVAGYSIKEKDEESVPESLCMLHKLDYLHFEGCVGGSKRFWSNIFKALKNLHTLALLNCRFTQQEVDYCAEAMRNLSSLVKFEVSETREVGRESSERMFTGNNMKCVAESLVNVPNVAELRVRGYHRMELSLELWCRYLKQLSHLQKLSLETCLLTKQLMKPVAEAFSGLPNLKELYLSDNYHLGDSAASWAFRLQSLKRLQKINLRHCGLFGQDMKLIAEAMGSLPYLKELNVSNNGDLHSSARLWSAYLRALKHLQKLNMTNCKLTVHDVEHVAEALGDLPDLVEVNLSYNKFLGGSGRMWSIHLKRVKNLDISGCFVDEPNMKRFAETLGHLVNLVELKLTLYRRPGSSGRVFCELFKNFENLQKLNLNLRPGLNSGDMEHVLGSLSRLCNLIELDLSVTLCNDTGEMWPEQLQLPVSLHRLKLLSISFPGGDGMNRILGSLSRLPKLVEVGLCSSECGCSRNRSLSGTAALWSNHLQQFNELQGLNLKDCDLTEDDEKVLRDSWMARGRKGLVIAFPDQRPSDPLLLSVEILKPYVAKVYKPRE